MIGDDSSKFALWFYMFNFRRYHANPVHIRANKLYADAAIQWIAKYTFCNIMQREKIYFQLEFLFIFWICALFDIQMIECIDVC